MNCTPQALARAAACYTGIPRDRMQGTWIFLLCQWAESSGFLCGAPSATIAITGAGMPGANQTYQQTGPTQWVGDTDPTWIMEVIGGQWILGSITEPDQYFASLEEWPCTWHLLPGGTGPPPTGVYVQLTAVTIPDGSGGFWRLIVDTLGNVGTESVPGPAGPGIVLADGSGGFWRVVVDTLGNRGTSSDPGPASGTSILYDATAVVWQLVVDTSGNLGASS